MTLLPLRPDDPPSLGDVELCGRLVDGSDAADGHDAGVLYAGKSGGDDVVVALLTAGAERDSYGRARFSDSLQRAGAADPNLVVAGEDEPDLAPWVALRAESWEEGVARACGLLAPAVLADVQPAGQPAGPRFRPHWARDSRAGRWRLWPLPWPATLTAAGRWTFAVAFGIVLALAALALFLAVRLFHNLPPAPVPPPFPQPSPTAPTGPSPTSPTGPTAPPGTSGPPTGGQPQPPVV